MANILLLKNIPHLPRSARQRCTGVLRSHSSIASPHGQPALWNASRRVRTTRNYDRRNGTLCQNCSRNLPKILPVYPRSETFWIRTRIWWIPTSMACCCHSPIPRISTSTRRRNALHKSQRNNTHVPYERRHSRRYNELDQRRCSGPSLHGTTTSSRTSTSSSNLGKTTVHIGRKPRTLEVPRIFNHLRLE